MTVYQKGIASVSGANGYSWCNLCTSSGYSRSASRIYPVELFSLIDFTSKLSTLSDHLNPPRGM